MEVWHFVCRDAAETPLLLKEQVCPGPWRFTVSVVGVCVPCTLHRLPNGYGVLLSANDGGAKREMCLSRQRAPTQNINVIFGRAQASQRHRPGSFAANNANPGLTKTARLIPFLAGALRNDLTKRL